MQPPQDASQLDMELTCGTVRRTRRKPPLHAEQGGAEPQSFRATYLGPNNIGNPAGHQRSKFLRHGRRAPASHHPRKTA